MRIGKSNYSNVYKGDLSILGKPTTVFIDRYRKHSAHVLWLFLLQVYHLYCQTHPNVISVLGYCDEEREKIVVFDYPEHGRLDQYIRRSNNTTSTTLTWLQRLEICTGAASGIDYVHKNLGIAYGNFEISKILLDDKWVARVTDFWIFTPSSTDAVADRAYFAPEFTISRIPTSKANVYSFGMVLFEVVCGKLCSEDVDGYILSAKLVKDLYEKKKLEEIIDPSLREQISPYCMDRYSAIAYRCLLDDPKERPFMDVVHKELEELLKKEVELNTQFEKRGNKALERAKAAEEREKVASEREKKMQAKMELIEEELARERTLRKQMEERIKVFDEMMIQNNKLPPPG